MADRWQPRPKRLLWAVPMFIAAVVILGVLFGTRTAVWGVLVLVAVGLAAYALDWMSKRALQ